MTDSNKNFIPNLMGRSELFGERAVIVDPFPAIYEDTIKKYLISSVPVIVVFLLYGLTVLVRAINAL